MKTLSANFALVQRSHGDNVLDRMDYQMLGIVWDKQKRRYNDHWEGTTRHLLHRVLIPEGNSARFQDASRLWAAAAAAETRIDSVEARIIDVHLPRGYSYLACAMVALALAKLFTDRGIPVQIDLQVSVATDGLPDIHVHMLLATRRFENDQFHEKKDAELERSFRAKYGRQMRREIAAIINRTLAPDGPEIIHADKAKDKEALEPVYPRWLMQRLEFRAELNEARKAMSEKDLYRLSRRIEKKINQLEKLAVMRFDKNAMLNMPAQTPKDFDLTPYFRVFLGCDDDEPVSEIDDMWELAYQKILASIGNGLADDTPNFDTEENKPQKSSSPTEANVDRDGEPIEEYDLEDTSAFDDPDPNDALHDGDSNDVEDDPDPGEEPDDMDPDDYYDDEPSDDFDEWDDDFDPDGYD